MMEGFGVHTFRFVNAAGESRFVKFHWRPRLGMQSTLWDEAVKISGADPDYHRRDLWEAISTGNPPEWDLGVQVFDEAFAEAQPYDVLDATKLIPEEDVPLMFVAAGAGPLADNFSRKRSRWRSCRPTSSGIDFSDDPLLQGASLPRHAEVTLGTANFHQIPVNAPKCPFQNFQRDGMMQTQVFKGRANYEPNSLAAAGEDGGPRESLQTGFVSVGHVTLKGDAAPKLRIRAERFADHYSQARLFYRSQLPIEQAHVASALVFELSKVQIDHVRTRVRANLRVARRAASGGSAAAPRHCRRRWSRST
jgi:catalase